MESLLRLDCRIGQFSAVCVPTSLGVPQYLCRIHRAVPQLDRLEDLDQLDAMRVLHGTSVFKEHPYKFCRPVLSAISSCLQAPSEQPQGPASFVGDSDGVRLPSGI